MTFKKIWQEWKRIAAKIGEFQSRVILTLFYFIMVTPFAILFQLLSAKKKNRIQASSLWMPIPPDHDVVQSSIRQF